MVSPSECLFCRIVKGEIPAKKVYEDSHSLAFLDINPRNPGHTLVIPKSHYETVFEMPESEGSRFFPAVKKVAVMVRNGVKAHGISLVQNNGSAAGQVVGHLHFHVIPRFLNEGPSAMEALLPVKKMDEKSLDKIASAISGAPQKAQELPETREARREFREEPEEPVEEKPKKPKKKEEKEKPREEPEPEEEDVDEFEEIQFNL